jgi:uncharacterized protein YegL
MGKCHIAIVLDMSGSMHSTAPSTRSGLLEFIRSQKRENPNATLTLTAFDNEFENWLDSVDIKLVKPTEIIKKYKPRGLTALYDAIGLTIDKLKKNVKKDDKVVFMIMTDGHENASLDYDRATIFEKITKLQNKNWTFVYLGANVDSYDESRKIGIFAGNTVNYSYGKGQEAAFSSLSPLTTTVFRSAKATTDSAFDDAGLEKDYTDKGVKSGS